MIWLLVIGIILVAVIVASAITYRPKDVSVMYICRKCFERRYRNTWLGMRLSTRPCQVCHERKVVDRVPVYNLERKGN